MGKHLGWGHEKGAEWPDRRPDKRTDLASWPDKQTTRRPLPLTFGKRPEGKGKHCRQGALFHRAPPLSKACSEKAPALKKAAGFVNGSGTLMPGQTGNLRSSLRWGCRQGPVMRAAEETGKRAGSFLERKGRNRAEIFWTSVRLFFHREREKVPARHGKFFLWPCLVTVLSVIRKNLLFPANSRHVSFDYRTGVSPHLKPEEAYCEKTFSHTGSSELSCGRDHAD